MSEHSINVLPKWARKLIMDLEKTIHVYETGQISIIVTSQCTMHNETGSISGEISKPQHFIAGDTITLSRPQFTLTSGCRKVPLPERPSDVHLKFSWT